MSFRSKLGYYLLRGLTWTIQLFPLSVHYFISDLFFLLIYHVIRYRRAVVYQNLNRSFPEKSKGEIRQIARKFYRNFCDSFIEMLYFDRVSASEIKQRVTISNQELLEKYLAQGRQVILAMGHYNNWEWNCSWPLNSKYTGYVIYKKLTNKSFDLFYYNMRSRFGIIPLERALTYRQLIADQKSGQSFASAFLMDQTPRKYEIQYWTTFLNQETAVLTGTEKVARKLNAVVLFCHIKKIKRGYNQLEFSLIEENARDTAPFEITEKATRMIEAVIVQRPELWLWSHKRWKHQKEPNARINNQESLANIG